MDPNDIEDFGDVDVEGEDSRANTDKSFVFPKKLSKSAHHQDDVDEASSNNVPGRKLLATIK